MAGMSTEATRVSDPILRAVARGYSANEFIGMQLFPRVPVLQRGGQVIQFGREDFLRYTNLQRAPGQNTKRIQFGYAGAPYTLKDYSLEGVLPIEIKQESQVPGIDMAARTVRGVQHIIAMNLELAQAALATNPANYPASNRITLPADQQFNNDDSDPVGIVEAGIEAIRAATGKNPNVMELGPKVYRRLRRHPQVREQLKYTSSAVANEAMLAAFFDIDRVVVGKAIYVTDAGVAVDAWGKSIVLAYTPIGDLASQGQPSYGYTYELEGYPDTEVPYYERNPKSFMYPVSDAVAPVLAGADSGYLIAEAIA